MITSKNIGKLTELIGIVDKIGKPYMRITNARFECPSCGTIISVLQSGKQFREPKKCSCGRRGGFVMISTETVEGQDIYVLEKRTEFGYIVYLEKKELIRKLTIIQEGCSVKVVGIPRVEFKKGYAVGDIVLDAKTLERNKRKVKYLEDKDIVNSDTNMTTKITEEIIDTSYGANCPQEIPNDQD